ncbi:MAG: hypothetical protein QGG71_17240 [Pirellulaceae bacterium]|nr:hypothetical protein [Pirellulaceae bacterium]
MLSGMPTKCLLLIVTLPISIGSSAETFQIGEDAEQITIETSTIKAAVRKMGYVSGVAGGSFVDKKTGATDLGFGLDIADWIMEPGSDEAYRDKLDDELVYRANNPFHGKRSKRSIEGPQICTRARTLSPKIIRGKDFVALQMSFNYKTAAPGKRTGSKWSQTIVFPAGKRYFVSSDRIDTVNSSHGMFLRIDMPGHLKHNRGDTFSQIYLSYLGQTNRPTATRGDVIPASSFFKDFAPDQWFNYRRDRVEEAGKPLPKRFIRAYRIRDRETGKDGPWLAGMTLDPSVVHEAWCHQRGYICMIEEFGGRPIKAGQSFSAAFIVGFFDSIDEMHRVYDQYAGHTGLTIDDGGWKLTK